MKVLYFLPGTILGGAETQLLTLCKELHGRGDYQLTVVTDNADITQPFWAEFPKYANVVRCETVGEIAATIRRVQPDVIQHFHNPWMSPAMDLAEYKGSAIEVVHGCVHFNNDTTSTPKNHTSHVVAVSNDARNFFLKKLPAWEKRTSVIPNGIDCTRFQPTQDIRPSDRPIRFIHVGRVCEGDKQYIKMIDACVQLTEENISWEFWIVGDGADTASIKEYAEYHAPGRVKFFGYTTTPENLYRKADVYLSRSPTEGFGLSVAEAAACGLPVVLWDCGGVARYFTPGKDALIVKKDPDFNGAVLGIARSTSAMLRKIMGTNARALALNSFSSQSMAKQYISLYEKMVEEKLPSLVSRPVIDVQAQSSRMVVGMSNPNFTGVSNAVRAWVGAGKWVGAAHPQAENLHSVYHRIAGASPEVLILGGDSGFGPLVKLLKKNLPRLKILLTWHGTFSFNSFAPGDGDLLSDWIGLLKEKVIDRIGFVRPNQHLALQDPRAVYFPNRVPAPKSPTVRPPLRTDPRGVHGVLPRKIGIFGTGFGWKNMQQMVIAAGQVPGVIIHVNRLDHPKLIRSLNIQVIEHGHLPQEQFNKLLSSMDLNIQGSFTESFGFTFCESYRMGVPCLTTPGVQVLPGYEHTCAKDPDDVDAVRRKIEDLYFNPRIEEVNGLLDGLDARNEEQIKKVLAEL